MDNDTKAPLDRRHQTNASKCRMTSMVLLGLAATLTLAGCSSDTPTATSSTEADAGAGLACTHFRNVMGDAAKGLLTDAELRTKIQEVYDSAHVSASPGVASGAQSMLAAVTAGDPTAFTAASTAFDTTCKAVGN
jgi:ABC-type Fe3+-hydroxamate transport system substrate-binding protein